MKVVFLDIDGVLNSNKEMIQFGHMWVKTKDVKHKLSPFGTWVMQRLSAHDVKIVLSSTWRLGTGPEEWKEVFDFPIYDKTCSCPFPGSVRGDEIALWLKEHPGVERYVIIDDDSDMLEEQMANFVKTNGMEGLTFFDSCKVCEILGLSIYDLKD